MLPGARGSEEFLASPFCHLIPCLLPQAMGRKQEGQASCPSRPGAGIFPEV